MIVFVIVPPGADMFNQRFMHDFHHDDQPRTIYFVPKEVSQAWWEERPWCELMSYDTYDLRQIRQTILDEFFDEDIHVVTRYDVALSRRLPRIQRLSGCTFRDVSLMVGWIHVMSIDFAHGSISLREHNKKERLSLKIEAAPTSFNFYRPKDVDFNFLDAPESLIDQDFTLAMLRRGFVNVVNYEFACRSTVDKVVPINREDAFALEKRHPGLVEAVEVNPGMWSVTCKWRQAYDPGR